MLHAWMITATPAAPVLRLPPPVMQLREPDVLAPFVGTRPPPFTSRDTFTSIAAPGARSTIRNIAQNSGRNPVARTTGRRPVPDIAPDRGPAPGPGDLYGPADGPGGPRDAAARRLARGAVGECERVPVPQPPPQLLELPHIDAIKSQWGRDAFDLYISGDRARLDDLTEMAEQEVLRVEQIETGRPGSAQPPPRPLPPRQGETFLAEVPPGYVPGEQFEAQPSGCAPFGVIVPPGAVPGDLFEVIIPPECLGQAPLEDRYDDRRYDNRRYDNRRYEGGRYDDRRLYDPYDRYDRYDERFDDCYDAPPRERQPPARDHYDDRYGDRYGDRYDDRYERYERYDRAYDRREELQRYNGGLPVP